MITEQTRLRAREMVSRMTDAEKAQLITGQDFWHLNGNPAYGLEPILVTDGPHGLRKQSGKADHVGLNQSDPATCFPTAAAAGCSFDRELMYEIGQALARECLEQGVAVLLGPGVNHKRSPLCGRNFEYFSEDPVLTGELAAAMVNGLQSLGVGACVKHFAANNQETLRLVADSRVDERTLREIYLKQFEIVVKKSRPCSMMTAYNRLNGVYCAENRLLMEEIARKEWGFDGCFITDWGGIDRPVESFLNGLELEMPGSCKGASQLVLESIQREEFPRERLDTIACRLVSLILHCQSLPRREFDRQEHLALARRAAQESAVLLQNRDGLLPLARDGHYALLGGFARDPRYQGAGSSKVNPVALDNPMDAFVQRGTAVEFAPGYREDGSADEQLLARAVQVARGKDAVVIFAGLPGKYESEGYDRRDLELPEGHNRLIEEVSRVNPNVVVVLQCGSVVTMPWLGQVKSVLHTYLSGCQGGGAAVDILLGDVCPSGKLAETYPEKPEDTPCHPYYLRDGKICSYREGFYTGYRYYDSAGIPVRFPFGFGLSYTEFSYSDLRLDRDSIADGEQLQVCFTLTNTGRYEGKEIVQLYLAQRDAPVSGPEKELKDFAKISLKPGESREVCFAVKYEDFAIFHTGIRAWYTVPGQYELLVGASVSDIRLRGAVAVLWHTPEPLPEDGIWIRPGEMEEGAFERLSGGKPAGTKARPVTLNTTFGELGETNGLFRLLTPLIRMIAARVAGGDEEQRKMAVDSVMEMPIRGAGMSGMFDRRGLQALVELLNGRVVSCVRLMMKK